MTGLDENINALNLDFIAYFGRTRGVKEEWVDALATNDTCLVAMDAHAWRFARIDQAVAFALDEMTSLLPDVQAPKILRGGTVECPTLYLKIMQHAARRVRHCQPIDDPDVVLPREDPRAIIVDTATRGRVAKRFPEIIDPLKVREFWRSEPLVPGRPISCDATALKELAFVEAFLDYQEYAAYWRKANASAYDAMLQNRRVRARFAAYFTTGLAGERLSYPFIGYDNWVDLRSTVLLSPRDISCALFTMAEQEMWSSMARNDQASMWGGIMQDADDLRAEFPDIFRAAEDRLKELIARTTN